MSGTDRVVPRFEFNTNWLAGDIEDLTPGPIVSLPKDEPAEVSQENFWAPGHLKILLHIYSTAEPYHPASPFYDGAVKTFVDLGLIEFPIHQANPQITKYGEALIRMLLATPLPEVSYADPRTGKRV